MTTTVSPTSSASPTHTATNTLTPSSTRTRTVIPTGQVFYIRECELVRNSEPPFHRRMPTYRCLSATQGAEWVAPGTESSVFVGKGRPLLLASQTHILYGM